MGDEGYEGNRGVQRRRRGRRRRGGGGGEEEGKCVTIAGQQTNEQTRKDRATQSMDHGRLRRAIEGLFLSHQSSLIYCVPSHNKKV